MELRKWSLQKWLIGLTLIGSLSTQIQAAIPTGYEKQRHLFQQAELAIKKGQLTYYKKLKSRLTDYPLLPYLEYKYLKRRLSQQPAESIQKFVTQYGDTPLATKLLLRWLKTRARKEDWQGLVDNYFTNNSRKLQCQYALALYKTGQTDSAHVVTENLWLTKRSLPKSCDKPIDLWRKAGQLSNDLLWQRIKLAMQGGNVPLTRYLGKMLPEKERFWIGIWEKVRRHPDYLMDVSEHFAEQNREIMRWVAVYGLRRLASKDPILAAEYREQLQQQFPFTRSEQAQIERRLVLNLVQKNSDEARDWLQKLKFSRMDENVISAYTLTAIRDQDWDTAMEWLNRLPPEQLHSEQWRYWRGRILESQGRLEESRSIYLLNANNRGYYSFLAADRIGNDYRFDHRPLEFSKSELSSLKTNPGVLRAGELYALKREADARREWNHTIARMDKAQLLKAAKLAEQWGWHDRTISTLARAEYWDDLEMRFPLAYQKQILAQAKKQEINPAWAFAVIRQESAFTSDARSHAGALGLMQLMPRTAKRMAQSLRIPIRGRHTILNSNTNIKLGVKYLRKVNDVYDGHPVLATAAYNAGGRNVKRWLPEQTTLPADIWIELVPFNETRKYMKRVLTYTAIYEQRLGMSPTPLLDRMSFIPATSTPAKISVSPALQPEKKARPS
ncbi:MAG: transglycosylase SLT domain-containing protein [Gammaproteobacteria bacterium]|nr:transglycosylase SLT domain-containing protein [Gammaproteobacteria bacterium]